MHSIILLARVKSILIPNTIVIVRKSVPLYIRERRRLHSTRRDATFILIAPTCICIPIYVCIICVYILYIRPKKPEPGISFICKRKMWAIRWREGEHEHSSIIYKLWRFVLPRAASTTKGSAKSYSYRTRVLGLVFSKAANLRRDTRTRFQFVHFTIAPHPNSLQPAKLKMVSFFIQQRGSFADDAAHILCTRTYT